MCYFLYPHESTTPGTDGIAMDNAELIDLAQRLDALRLEHRDLDDAIMALQANPYVDQLQMKRLKHRKLQLKDAISRVESELIPDLNA